VRALLAALLLAGCAAPACQPGSERWIRAELLFGLSRKNAPELSAAEWNGFLADTVTPRFPDGLTVLDGRGQWRNRATGRIASENSKIVVIAAPEGAETQRRLREIAEAYDRRFGQEAVGLIEEPACVGFIGVGPSAD
jgi:hypothetical protein